MSAQGTLWLFTIHLFTITRDPLWIRVNGVVSSFLPWSVALVVFSIGAKTNDRGKVFFNASFWLIAGLLVSFLCFSPGYLSSEYPLHRGPGYFVHNMALALAYALVIIIGLVGLRKHTGIARHEFQFILLNFGLGGLTCIALLGIGNHLEKLWLKHTALTIVFIIFALAAWATTPPRLYGFGQIVGPLVRWFSKVLLLLIGIIGLLPLAERFISWPFDLLATLAICSSIAAWATRITSHWPRLRGDNILASLRQAVIELSRTYPQTHDLIIKLEALLRERFDCNRTVLLFEGNATFSGSDIILEKNSVACRVISDEGWITLDSIERRRFSVETEAVKQWLLAHSLSVLIATPRGSPAPSLIIGLGKKVTEFPVTYPEVECLIQIAELIDNILSHSRLIEHAAMEAKMQHLAMMSRGLAHDIKNIITPIASFLMHTEYYFPAESPEAEVHDAARRAVRVINEYVSESLFFSEKLEPRFEKVNVCGVINNAKDLANRRAKLKGVLVKAQEAPAAIWITADSILVQRLIVNLISNAIDASAGGQIVIIEAAIVNNDFVAISIRDQGVGMSPQTLARIFEPYFTTKQFGDEVRGFGLGLTICQKIVNLHAGKIRVQSEPNKGTTVTVELPMIPPKHLIPTGPCLALP